MSQGDNPKKILVLFLMFFAATLSVMNGVHAQEAGTTDPTAVQVTVEQAGQGDRNHTGVERMVSSALPKTEHHN